MQVGAWLFGNDATVTIEITNREGPFNVLFGYVNLALARGRLRGCGYN